MSSMLVARAVVAYTKCSEVIESVLEEQSPSGGQTMCGVAIPERVWWQGMRQSSTRASESGRSASEAERAMVFGAAFLRTAEIDPKRKLPDPESGHAKPPSNASNFLHLSVSIGTIICRHPMKRSEHS